MKSQAAHQSLSPGAVAILTRDFGNPNAGAGVEVPPRGGTKADVEAFMFGFGGTFGLAPVPLAPGGCPVSDMTI